MTSFGFALLFTTQVTAPTALIAVGDTVAPKAAFEAAARDVKQRGDTPLKTEELLARLLGSDAVREPNLQALSGMLEDARQREARFDTAGAQALRQEILRAFDTTARPDNELRVLTREAMQDWTANLLAENDKAGAKKLAQETWRRFGPHALDSKRHPPSVREFVERVYAEQRSVKTGIVQIKSDLPGELWLEARRLGAIQTAARYALPQGTYRLWVVTEKGMSLPYVVHVADTAQVTLHAALDVQLEVTADAVHLSCQDTCDEALTQLSERLGVNVLPVRTSPNHGVLNEPSKSQSVSSRGFNYLSVVPLGGGQFFQDRPVAAGVVLAAQLGTLAWNLVAFSQHAPLKGGDNARSEDAWRTHRNVSAVAFYSTLALGLADALIYELALKQ